MQEPIIVFTDGACSGNPGPGGWASIVKTQDSVIELGGRDNQTTNNRMELIAVREALQFILEIAKSGESEVHVYTDSVYVIRGITQWIFSWMRNQWKTKEGEEVLNRDLWIELNQIVQELKKNQKIQWHYCRGHVGIPGNERCDEIAVAFSKGAPVQLFRGHPRNYTVDLSQFPEDSSLPEMKPITEKKKAHSYLSKVGSIVYRHQDWAACERRVKGQSGALFKKAMSPDDEIEILKSWGLSAATVIKDQ